MNNLTKYKLNWFNAISYRFYYFNISELDWLSTKKDPVRCFRHSPVHHLQFDITIDVPTVYLSSQHCVRREYIQYIDLCSRPNIQHCQQKPLTTYVNDPLMHFLFYKTNQKMLLGYIFCISVIHFIKKQFNTQEDVDVKCSFIYFNEKTILMLKIIFDFFCPDV